MKVAFVATENSTDFSYCASLVEILAIRIVGLQCGLRSDAMEAEYSWKFREGVMISCPSDCLSFEGACWM